MKREPAALGNQRFDVLVIGGGIYGAWTAYDAALRGLKVALVDKRDWASATSSSSTKLLHGGLRYLERFEIGLVRKSLHERAVLARLLPHAVHPLRFVVPLYAHSRVKSWQLRAGLTLYDQLSGKNDVVPKHESISRSELEKEYPFLCRDGLKRAFAYGDCKIDDARFALDIVVAAERAGATVVNYAMVERLTRNAGRATGAIVCDVIRDRLYQVEADVIVNTGGPWAAELSSNSSRTPTRLTKGVHLVMPALPTEDAFLFLAGDGRVFFAVPWYGRTLLGTTDTDFTGDVERIHAEDDDVAYLLRASNAYLTDTGWDESDVIARFAGVRAMVARDGRAPSDVSREWSLRGLADGVIMSQGGKYTSARVDASEMVDLVQKRLGRGERQSRTGTTPLPTSPDATIDVWLADVIARARNSGVDERTARVLATRYGARMDAVLALIDEDTNRAERIVDDLPFIWAEVDYAVAHEMAMRLDDVVRRRIPLSILHTLTHVTLDEIAQRIAPVLGWNEAERENEVMGVVKRMQ